MFIQRLAKSAFCAVTLIVCSFIVMGQAISPQERQRIIRVQDVEAAGNSGDKTFIPFLKDVLQSRKLDHQNWDRPQMALAKLGEREQQQQIVCIFYRGDNYEAQNAGIRQLPFIGGWFSIRLYVEMLANKQIYSHWGKSEPHGSDAVLESPQGMALTYLPKLVPGLPPLNEKDWKQTQRLWPEYIRKHEAELNQLEPQGEGVDFSGSSCKNNRRERSIR
jgi:hypothetical protein